MNGAETVNPGPLGTWLQEKRHKELMFEHGTIQMAEGWRTEASAGEGGWSRLRDGDVQRH